MKKLVLSILLLTVMSHSFTRVTLNTCTELPSGGYVGKYKQYSGKIYTMAFKNHCPQFYIFE
jgi:hypothetical protein